MLLLTASEAAVDGVEEAVLCYILYTLMLLSAGCNITVYLLGYLVGGGRDLLRYAHHVSLLSVSSIIDWLS